MKKGFELLESLLLNADKGKSQLRKLNWVLSKAIPFNMPHRIKVSHISDNRVEAVLPYRKSNLNHLRSLHAAALMTVGEFCSGIWLMRRAGSRYRLIMKSCRINYHKQGRTSARAIYELSDEQWISKIKQPLETDGVVLHICEVKVKDENNELLAEVNVEWQIKDWSKVGEKKISN